MLKQVRLLQNYMGKVKGQLFCCGGGVADCLIRGGIAEEVQSDKTLKPKNKRLKKEQVATRVIEGEGK